MDAVYVLGDDAEYLELRYSIRSILSYVDDVVIAGSQKPTWFTGRFIPSPQNGSRFTNTSNHLLAAMPEVSDPLLLMNDDFFALRKDSEFGGNQGLLSDWLDGVRHSVAFRRGGLQAAELLSRTVGVMQCELHLPMTVRHDPMKEAIGMLRRREYSEAFKRTVYCSITDDYGPFRKDVKGTMSEGDWTSTRGPDDPIMVTIQGLYPVPSRWESDADV